jgi:hypothetical protein
MRAFANELHALRKRRIALPELRAAYLRAHPEAANAPDLRRLLLEALRALGREGMIELPDRGWDRSGSPPLPRTARFRDGVNSRRTAEPHAWLPVLSFAASERHPARRADLQAINAFLLSSRGRKLVSVPTNERSLQIFGDEKRLDRIRKGRLTLFEGRLSLDDLSCYPVAPPLPYESPKTRAVGAPILVVENYQSYESFCRWNEGAAAYAAIAFGGGNAFRQGAGNLDDLITRNTATGAIYLGDLDPAGVQILLGVNASRIAGGQLPLRPHLGLYKWLLAHGCRRPLSIASTDGLVTQLQDVFPADVASALIELWSGAERIPQESFGLEQLSSSGAVIAGPDSA